MHDGGKGEDDPAEGREKVTFQLFSIQGGEEGHGCAGKMGGRESVAAGEFDEDVLEGGMESVEAAERPVLFPAQLADAFACVGAGVDEDGKVLPAVVGEFVGDFFDLIEFAECFLDVLERSFRLEHDASGGPHLSNEVGRGIGGFDAASVDDDDFVAEHFHLAEDVGGNEDGVVLAEALDEATDGANLIWVESVGGLVEDEELGVVNEGIGDSDALAKAFREGVDHLAADLLEAAFVEDIFQPPAQVVAVETFEFSTEGEVFLHPHVGVERDGFGEVSDFPACLERVALDVESGDGGAAFGRREKAGEHPDGGRFASSIWP